MHLQLVSGPSNANVYVQLSSGRADARSHLFYAILHSVWKARLITFVSRLEDCVFDVSEVSLGRPVYLMCGCAQDPQAKDQADESKSSAKSFGGQLITVSLRDAWCDPMFHEHDPLFSDRRLLAEAQIACLDSPIWLSEISPRNLLL